MTAKRAMQWTASGVLLALAIGLAAPRAGGQNQAVPDQAMGRFMAEHPRTAVSRGEDGRIARVYGQSFSTGATAKQSAQRFVDEHAAIWGVSAAELARRGPFDDGRHETPIYFDRERGVYRFTGVHFTQERDGVPVFGAQLRLLVRNEPGYPLVLASADLRDLGTFRLPPRLPAIDEAGLRRGAVAQFGEQVVVSGVRHVIWAGVDDMSAPPALAIAYVTEAPGVAEPEKWLHLIDAQNGQVLHREDLVFHADVQGTVTGWATNGFEASACQPLHEVPLPYARITDGTNVSFADASGVYVLDVGTADPVTIESGLWGQWFRVYNDAGADTVLSQTVNPPATVDFVHNATAPDEFTTAEVDCYLHSNIVRDYALSFNPAYPTIDTQTEFAVNVNLSADCNAFYNGSSINFYDSGGGCNNTGFSGVVYHEYGHHLVNTAGSGQGQYGEGMSDCIALLITEDPELGRGFSTCGSGIRTAVNNFQYPCSGGVHYCGNLLSGCVWSLRNQLISSEPSTYLDTLSALTINSILLHTGSLITPQITIDFLTLDDDNANIFDGTPHWNEIMTAFGDHNMTPDLPMVTFSFPNGLPHTVDQLAGATVRVEVLPDNGVPLPGSGMAHVDTGSGFVVTPMSVVSDNVYDAVIPPVPCGQFVRFFFSADATIGYTQSGPIEPLSAIGGLDSTVTFTDDFETVTGWSVIDDPLLTDGTWQRAIPAGGGDRGDPPTDADGSGFCYVTDNADGNSDVDGGPTALTSPALNVGVDHAFISYYRWYHNTAGDNPGQDTMLVLVSDDDGATWRNLETVGPTGPEVSGGWVRKAFDLTELPDFELNATFRIRFIASDDDLGSIVEAGVDGVQVLSLDCLPTGDLTGDGTVNIEDLLAMLTVWGPCAGCPADLNGDGSVNVLDILILLENWG